MMTLVRQSVKLPLKVDGFNSVPSLDPASPHKVELNTEKEGTWRC